MARGENWGQRSPAWGKVGVDDGLAQPEGVQARTLLVLPLVELQRPDVLVRGRHELEPVVVFGQQQTGGRGAADRDRMLGRVQEVDDVEVVHQCVGHLDEGIRQFADRDHHAASFVLLRTRRHEEPPSSLVNWGRPATMSVEGWPSSTPRENARARIRASAAPGVRSRWTITCPAPDRPRCEAPGHSAGSGRATRKPGTGRAPRAERLALPRGTTASRHRRRCRRASPPRTPVRGCDGADQLPRARRSRASFTPVPIPSIPEYAARSRPPRLPALLQPLSVPVPEAPAVAAARRALEAPSRPVVTPRWPLPVCWAAVPGQAAPRS